MAFLRQRLEQHRGQKTAPQDGEAAAPTANDDPQATRAFLVERIERLQAQLAKLDEAERSKVEDATVVEETPPAQDTTSKD